MHKIIVNYRSDNVPAGADGGDNIFLKNTRKNHISSRGRGNLISFYSKN